MRLERTQSKRLARTHPRCHTESEQLAGIVWPAPRHLPTPPRNLPRANLLRRIEGYLQRCQKGRHCLISPPVKRELRQLRLGDASGPAAIIEFGLTLHKPLSGSDQRPETARQN